MASSERRIALVTGANRGLGLETARQLAGIGFRVLMGCRRAGAGRAAAKLLRGEGLDAEFLRMDVTKPDQIREAAAAIGRRFGRLDVLVNNAGMGAAEEERSANSTAVVSPTVLRKTFDVNFFGLVEVTRRMLPLLRKSEAGRIVNVSSILGSLAVHSASGGASYMPFACDASKTAVNAFTIHLAAALEGTGIKVNSAHPGWVRTDMGGPNAPLSPAEGARTAFRLATLGPDGPTGRFFHEEKELPW
jgi:NAD(P)-dependent dehydrogenase (short-subunit alcohol dehydrogenase family)